MNHYLHPADPGSGYARARIHLHHEDFQRNLFAAVIGGEATPAGIVRSEVLGLGHFAWSGGLTIVLTTTQA